MKACHLLLTCTIIDGQALAQAIGKPKGAKTFADLADVFVQTVFRHVKMTALGLM